MKTQIRSLAVGILLSLAVSSPGATLYVDPNSPGAASPFGDWNTAATNIQDAVDAATDGDLILVTNGVYAIGGRPVYGSLTNRVVIDKAVTVQSVNGPTVTIIQGNPVLDDTAVRCVYLTNGASLIGFTLTQGGTRNFQGDMYLEWRGGGAYCESTNAMISNCVFSANSAANGGGGIIGGTLEDCILTNNTTTVNYLGGNGGGGALGSALNHCVLVGNSSVAYGGGADSCTLNFCLLAGNTAGDSGGGVNGGTLNNCILTNNWAGNVGGGANGATLNNCDLVENSAYACGGAYGGVLNNCIVYYNQATDPYTPNSYGGTMNRCCTTPHAGTGNFTNEPTFVDLAAGDFHLQSTSFCINAGDNGTVATTVDWDGNPRVVGLYVDVGAFEYQSVAPLPLSASAFADYTNVAMGFVVNLTGEIGGHETLSYWDLGDGMLVTNQLNLSHAWSASGDYLVTLTAYDGDHPAGVSASLTIHVVANPIYYVALDNPTPTAPFGTWATAANSIQDAVDVAAAGGMIWVSNGVYQTGGSFINGGTGNRLSVTTPIKIQSVSGPTVTIIRGYTPPTTNSPASVRCVYLANGASLSGFTLTNGSTSSDAGGGAFMQSGALSNCVVVGNYAKSYGGGVFGGFVDHCVIKQNFGQTGGGAAASRLSNCLIVSNTATVTGGGVYNANLTNCTVVGNYAALSGGGSYQGTLRNCIVYFNEIGNATATNYSGSIMSFCCAKPLPAGLGNFTNDPAFANLAGSDFHLQAVSPCVNTGTNVLGPDDTDLDGNPRWKQGNIDLGAYEFQTQIHYVAVNNTTPVSPYTNWLTAATNIQDAIDVANAGEFVIVSNGNYKVGGRAVYGSATNRVTIDRPVAVQSVNGPAGTTITGFDSPAGANYIRCVYLTNGASLSGFTLTNGGTRTSGDIIKEESGGGVWCESSAAVVSNCVIAGSWAYRYGAGAFGGTLWNCTLANNTNGAYGGAVASNIVINCTLTRNGAAADSGGGAYGSQVFNSTVSSNSGGGLAYCFSSNSVLAYNSGTDGGGALRSTLQSCKLIGNSAGYGGGADFSVLTNCLVFANRSTEAGGGTADGTILVNCTVVSNLSSFHPLECGASASCKLINTIAYFNGTNGNYPGNYATNCCVIPLPSGFGNFTNAPLFVDLTNGDLHLQSNSPCINSGANIYAANLATDLDGQTRIMGTFVDVGAYEYQMPISVLPYSWLWQFGLATDGSADFADPDGDGLNNWQEWRAGTTPTNAASVLKVNSVMPTNDFSQATITWQSVSGKMYVIDRASDLAAQSAFSTVASNIVGQVGTTSYTDTNATSNAAFYRVGVQ